MTKNDISEKLKNLAIESETLSRDIGKWANKESMNAICSDVAKVWENFSVDENLSEKEIEERYYTYQKKEVKILRKYWNQIENAMFKEVNNHHNRKLSDLVKKQ